MKRNTKKRARAPKTKIDPIGSLIEAERAARDQLKQQRAQHAAEEHKRKEDFRRYELRGAIDTFIARAVEKYENGENDPGAAVYRDRIIRTLNGGVWDESVQTRLAEIRDQAGAAAREGAFLHAHTLIKEAFEGASWIERTFRPRRVFNRIRAALWREAHQSRSGDAAPMSDRPALRFN